MSEHPNEETQKIITEGGDFGALIAHPGWKLFEDKIDETCRILDSWSSLPDGLTPSQKVKEMDKRQGSVALLKQVIQEIKGSVENAVAIAQTFAPKVGETSQVLRYTPPKTEDPKQNG
jgi:hypothetical protein